MNEQVKILWAKAAESTIGDSWEEQTKFMERFAELIVKECINEIAYIGKANEVFGDRIDRGGLNHILWTTETAIEKIKQHFGVEE
jgi:predicted P-loop ATPase